MQDQHIASAFDRDLEAIQAMVMKMGGMVETAIRLAAKSMEQRDIELAEKVRDDDKHIDRLEEQINQEAARVIALRQPTARDLRTLLSVIKISGNLERCGDYAKNLAKRTALLAQIQPIGGTAHSIRRMALEVEQMLKDVLDAYIQHDVQLAESVRHADQEVDQIYNAMFREILTHMMEDPRNITACMHMHFIAKNIERTGDHITSIAEQIIYQVTGDLPEDSRPKGDQSTYAIGEEDMG